MEWKDAKRELVRKDWKLRWHYYKDLKHQLRRLWWKIKSARDTE